MRWTLLFLVVAFSCGKPDPEALKSKLTGYWEIEKVQLPDGSEREYSINTTIDYIEVNGEEGVRKKLQPQLDGSFKTFDQNEQFNTLVRNDSLILQYATPFATWEEAVLEADGTVLTVLNSDGKKFFYKAFEPLSLE